MEGSLRVVAALALVGALMLAPSASARPAAQQTSLDLVKRGLARSVARGWIDSADSRRYGGITYTAIRAIPRLPGSRASNLAAVLADVVAQRDQYTAPRALALFSMLQENTYYLARRWLPPAGTDVIADDGVLYRSFPGQGLQFHPLGNFARLGNLMLQQREGEAVELAQALVDRGVASGPALTWEYYFPFGGGRPPWTSGMAQAVAAQALARVDYEPEARRAYLALPRGLLVWLADGPWVRLYRFSTAPVLNAQLQTAVSLATYATLTGDDEAVGLAVRMRTSALALLPRFDTGYWSLYALGGGEASLNYHRYVVSLLKTLAQRTQEPAWETWYERFDGYLTEPPVVDAKAPTAAVANRRPARVSFWLSKSSRVTLSVGGGAQSIWLAQGYHTLTWSAAGRRPGTYAASLAATDLAGNRARVQLAPVVVRRR